MPNAPLRPLVDISGVSFSYAERPVLSGIDMRFGRGQVIAVMGASGSGKTTILRLIGGMLMPSAGKLLVDGEDLSTLTKDQLFAARRKMGMLFQFGALFTDLSVFENVAFPLREHTELPDTIISDLVLMKLHAVGLRGAHALRPSQISGGMARRVALARAIALDPQVILYDEPFAGLDPISLSITANLIKHLNDVLGAASVLVTHEVQETFAIADYVYFIANGRVAAEGTPAELTESKDAFVRQFIDAQPDGPVPFHYPAAPYRQDLGLTP